MKKIKALMLAMLAMVASISFTACSSDDDDNNTDNNIEDFQKIVDEKVQSNKKHNKAILIVAFGSTWQQAFDTFDAVEAKYKAEFGSEYDVFLSFSSAICINQAHAWEHKDDGAEQRDYYGPEYWLTAIGKSQYKEVVVQSLQVTPGEEFRLVRDKAVKDFMNNKYRVFTDEYMKSIDKKVQVGTPLLAEEEDVDNLAKVLLAESDVKSVINAGGVVAFMGHGNPVGYDYGGANIRYNQLEEALQNLTGKKNFFVGTVDDEDNLVGDVLDRMNVVAKGTKVQLYPLMSIAGDHAHNDLADAEDAESWYTLMNKFGFMADAEETNFSEVKWKQHKAGDGYIPGLAERSKVLQLWINHTKAAIQSIKAGEGLSTPTTESEEE